MNSGSGDIDGWVRYLAGDLNVAPGGYQLGGRTAVQP